MRSDCGFNHVDLGPCSRAFSNANQKNKKLLLQRHRLLSSMPRAHNGLGGESILQSQPA